MGDPTVHLYACLDSLFAQNRTPLEVWVVAYLMQAEHREALAARYPAIHIIESREVRGSRPLRSASTTVRAPSAIRPTNMLPTIRTPNTSSSMPHTMRPPQTHRKL